MTGRDWAAYTALLVGVVAILLAAYSCVPARAADCPGQWLKASWYGMETCRKGTECRTADGSHFDGTQMLAAHKTLPFGTKLRVTYKGRSVVVTVRDRGPFVKGRSLDLSRAAAANIGMIEAGVGTVCVVRM